MKQLLLLLLLGLVACQGEKKALSTNPTGSTAQWRATIADQLFERQLLNNAGRDSLKQRIAANKLCVYYSVPGSGNSYPHQAVDPATILAFCVEAFLGEELYRTGIGEGYQSPTPAQVAAALRQARGDTAAALRRLASPAMLLEINIPAEDKVVLKGWTIYPPLGRPTGLTHAIADTRSTFGKTRTRTARDLYELGLLTQPDYELIRQELGSGQLPREVEVCQRAAQLALDKAVRPARRVALDSVLTKLRQTGVLTAAGQQRALADSQLLKSFQLFDIVPYCAHTRVLNLHELPREPSRLYPRILAEVAAIMPSFRYTNVQVMPSERDTRGSLLDELVELSFLADGRRYATTFTQDYRRKDGQNPDPATGAEIAENFEAGINQWLRDQGAPERLHQASMPDTRSAYGRDRLGLILLTPAQRDAWGLASYFLSPESQGNYFTSAYLEQALALYQRIGLFRNLTALELVEGHRQALSGETTSYVELLHCFPRLLAEMGGEDAEEPQAYAKALRQIAATTRGAFQPTRIQDSFTGQQARNQPSTLAFSCGTRQYRATLTSDLGWMDYGFVNLVERAVRENTSGQLYYLGEGDETGEYLFLTAAQATAIRQAQPELFQASDEHQTKR